MVNCPETPNNNNLNETSRRKKAPKQSKVAKAITNSMNQNEVGSLKPPRVTKMLKVKPEGALGRRNQSLHQKNQ